MNSSNPPPHTVLLGMVLVVVVCMLLLFAGCTSTGDNPPSRPISTVTTTGGLGTVSSVRPECRQVADDARALATEVGRLATGDASVDEVRTAVTRLATSFDEARAVAGAEARAGLDQAGQALREFQDLLGTQPVDTAALRSAAGDLVTALGDAATVCVSGAPTSTS